MADKGLNEFAGETIFVVTDDYEIIEGKLNAVESDAVNWFWSWSEYCKEPVLSCCNKDDFT
jgi:hypothetical protein